MNVDHDSLRDGFAQFVTAARELERSYAALKERAAAVDLELQQVNRALQTSLAEREAVFAALPIGLVVVAGDGALRSRNREAERLCALEADGGVHLLRRLDGDHACGQGLVRVRRVPLADGELVLLEDRSRMRELEDRVHRLDRLAGLSELALGIAHEIKNPLNGVMGFAALLARSEEPAAMRRFAQKVVQGVQQVDEIVKAMLGFARPERDRSRTATIAEIVAEAAQGAGLPAVRVRVLGGGGLRHDAEALTRVLGNLFRNAIEAAPAARLEVTAAARSGQLELVVQDDGPGVPAELADRVFEPFVSSKERGTGLGLPLCMRVLACLGGDLQLMNPGRSGARFRVRLPALDEGVAAATDESVEAMA